MLRRVQVEIPVLRRVWGKIPGKPGATAKMLTWKKDRRLYVLSM